ncbi:MAG: ankyrin repeat domain-containing protein [Vicinamibacterales bacterium]
MDEEIKMLLEAISENDGATARDLLARQPALVHAADENGKTPLHMAGEKNNVELMELLLSLGADLQRETHWGMTPIQWAASLGSRRAVELFLSRGGAALDLRSAAGIGDLETVQRFWEAPGKLKPGAAQKKHQQLEDGTYVALAPPTDYTEIVSDAFFTAARNGHTRVASWLLEQGADVHVKGTLGATALHWAAGNGHRDTVRFLLDHGADADKELVDEEFGVTPAGWARHFGQTEIAEMLERGDGT